MKKICPYCGVQMPTTYNGEELLVHWEHKEYCRLYRCRMTGRLVNDCGHDEEDIIKYLAVVEDCVTPEELYLYNSYKCVYINNGLCVLQPEMICEKNGCDHFMDEENIDEERHRDNMLYMEALYKHDNGNVNGPCIRKILINVDGDSYSLSKDVYDYFEIPYDGDECLEERARDDPELIRAVEKIGVDESSGRLCTLKIVEIPGDVDWTIQETDGVEWVAEKHRTWD